VSIQRNRLAVLLLAAALVVLAVPMGAGAGVAADPGPATTIQLPDGFQPEGIAIGSQPFAYFGSRVDGDIYRANLIDGSGQVISQGPGTASLGMKLDGRNRLYVAGAQAGNGRIVDAGTGDILASYTFTTGATFVNDVALTPDAAWFTDSLNAVLYKVPRFHSGRIATQAEVVTVPLTGDFVLAPGFNLNGITRTPDGSALIVVQSNTGRLFRVDPATGVTTGIDLGGESVPNGDGILVTDRTLYVVQNVNNVVTVIRLNPAGTSGTLKTRVTDPRFDVPTTLARFGSLLYLPNARFTTPPTPTTPYSANAIPAA
jgi:sugar lactone lactonase YvrE